MNKETPVIEMPYILPWPTLTTDEGMVTREMNAVIKFDITPACRGRINIYYDQKSDGDRIIKIITGHEDIMEYGEGTNSTENIQYSWNEALLDAIADEIKFHQKDLNVEIDQKQWKHTEAAIFEKLRFHGFSKEIFCR